MSLLFSIRVAESLPAGEKAVRFTMRVFHGCLSISMCFLFSLWFCLWDVGLDCISPEHCLFYFTN